MEKLNYAINQQMYLRNSEIRRNELANAVLYPGKSNMQTMLPGNPSFKAEVERTFVEEGHYDVAGIDPTDTYSSRSSRPSRRAGSGH